MRSFFGILFVCALAFAAVIAVAQPPAGERRAPQSGFGTAVASVDRLITFDKNQDGELSKDELADERLHALFERADENNDESLTKIELFAFFEKEVAQAGGQQRGQGGPGGGGRGPGEPGGPGQGGPPPGGAGGRGPGGPGQAGAQGNAIQSGMSGGPQFGGGQGQQQAQMNPMLMLEMLNLNDEQRKQIQELQREFDARLEKILTAEQKRQLNDLRVRAAGGPAGSNTVPARPADADRSRGRSPKGR